MSQSAKEMRILEINVLISANILKEITHLISLSQMKKVRHRKGK